MLISFKYQEEPTEEEVVGMYNEAQRLHRRSYRTNKQPEEQINREVDGTHQIHSPLALSLESDEEDEEEGGPRDPQPPSPTVFVESAPAPPRNALAATAPASMQPAVDNDHSNSGWGGDYLMADLTSSPIISPEASPRRPAYSAGVDDRDDMSDDGSDEEGEDEADIEQIRFEPASNEAYSPSGDVDSDEEESPSSPPPKAKKAVAKKSGGNTVGTARGTPST